ncbi:MAG: HAMP domain-containing sensor histidine kinase [Spirochaetaceae bacterium]|nr:HAMP domain-containing sensor histidine kinase [Spirochaetaceae bacterium]
MRGHALGLIALTLAAVAAVTLAAVGSIARLTAPEDAARAAAHLQEARAAVRNAHAAESAADARTLLEEASQQLDAAGGLLAGAEVVQAAVSRTVLVTVGAAGLFGILAGSFLWFGSFRWVVKPLSRLAGHMRRLTDRPSPIEVAARGPREIRALQRSFNRLVAELNDYRERIANMERANIGRYLTHQFRNSLTPIRLGADQLAAMPAPDTRSIAAMLRDEAARMEAILDRFVTLYRFPEPQPAELDIALLMRQLAGGYPGVRVAVPGDPVLVQADSTLLEQALANLVQNAIDATAGSDYGSVTVSVSDRPAVITVRDRGAGMTQDEQDRAFDDYYTTKDSGMGVGLGFVRKVAAAHGIRMTMRSRPGRGTTVDMAFP